MREIGLGIGVDLLARQRRAGFGYASGVADHGGEIADQKNSGVAQILKMLQLAKDHGVAKMKIGGRGIHAEIGAQRLAGFQRVIELGFQLGFRNDFSDAFFQVGKLFFDGFEFHLSHGSASQEQRCRAKARRYVSSITKSRARGGRRFCISLPGQS